MGANSKIEWTNHTWNPWWGCTKVNEKCKNCYANALAKRYRLNVWGPMAERRQMSDDHWKQPLKWNRENWQCDACGEWSDISKLILGLNGSFDQLPGRERPEYLVSCPHCKSLHTMWRRHPRVFCASMADVFEGADTCQNPAAYEMIRRERRRLFDLIRLTPNLDWQLLTKRPQNIVPMIMAAGNEVTKRYCASQQDNTSEIAMLANWLDDWANGDAPRNVWIGTSNEQDSQVLAEVPAVVRFLSIEPLLGEPGILDLRGIHWAIVGGESGPDARPMQVEWAMDIQRQCEAAGVAFFAKQLGKRPVFVGQPIRLKDGHGGDWDEWPEEMQGLKVREFPEAHHAAP